MDSVVNEANSDAKTAPDPLAGILGMAIDGIAILTADTVRSGLKKMIAAHTTAVQGQKTEPKTNHGMLAAIAITAVVTAILIQHHNHPE